MYTVVKIVICNCPMASGDCLVALIAKLAKVGGVQLVGLVTGLDTHDNSSAANVTTCLHSCLHS
jgi:hypothetical protein